MKSKVLIVLGCVLALGTLTVSGCGSATVESLEPAAAESRPVVYAVELREGDTYQVVLETDPDADAQWEVGYSEELIELVDRTADQAADREVFTFRARATGVTEAYFSYTEPQEVIYNFNIGADLALAGTMSEAQAREIATGSPCGEKGALRENAVYNDWTATWWIDLDPEQGREGCNPACVVDVRTGRAEINWRCTGALPPEDADQEAKAAEEIGEADETEPTPAPADEMSVDEVPAPETGYPVVAWGGFVSSLPAGAQFDDYVALEPEEVGGVGLVGVDNTVEAQIQMLRDSDTCAHFWGTLVCPAIDYGGCQLVVDRLREDRPGPFFDPDPVEGWEGAVVGTPEGAQFDDSFRLAGDFPVGFGIGSVETALAARLEDLRDSGARVRVWGQVEAGVPDTFGSRIEVTRLEVVEADAPALWVDTQGWNTYTNEVSGYTLQYPGDATLMESPQGTGIQISGPLIGNERWPFLEVSHFDSEFYHPPADVDVVQWVTGHVIAYDEIETGIEVAGLPAVHLVNEATEQSYAFDEYYFVKGNQLFRVAILHAGGQQDWDLYNAFLGSFTFD